MKKIHIALAVLAAAVLTSCQQEKSFNGKPLDEGDVAFIMQAGASTRAADLGSPVMNGINVPIGKVGNMNLYLEETISDLDYYITPETRGVPVFTENVGKLYANDLFVHAVGGGFGDAVFETDGVVGDGWRYSHHYADDKDPWPANDGNVDFYLRMPSDMTGVTFGDNAYGSGAKTTFTYTSPLTAEDQTDIIFTGITLKESTHKTNLPEGTPVTFYHALTAVKFAIANPEDEVENIQVTNISFTGLKNTGTCTVDPYADVKVTWPSTSATTTTEGEGDAAITKPNVIQQDFEDGELVEFSKTNNPDFGDSFFNPGTEEKPGTADTQNINTQTASKTFWLVPQTFAGSSAVLGITYLYNGNEEHMDLDLGELLANVEWKAGQLRTYTIKFDEVNIKIEDTVTMGTGDVIVGGTKEAVKITNTGNVDVFIRAAIVGQWLDKDNNPVFGFTDNINFLYEVESWYEDQFVKETAGTHGKFYDLAGYKGASSTVNDWFYNEDDQYYYYTKSVAPDGVTSNLFSKYEILKVPHTTNAGEVLSKDMYFVLEVASQAISARKRDGTLRTDYMNAWAEALAFGEGE